MPTPERSRSNTSTSVMQTELATELNAINRQLELTDENENPIERLVTRDELLAQQDWFQKQIGELTST